VERNPAEHLGTSELARLLEESGWPRGFVDTEDVHPHLASCAFCREQFEEMGLAESQLDHGRPKESRSGDCPVGDEWRAFAGGLTPRDRALDYIGHASRCDYCGPRLREALIEFAELNGELTEAERQQIASLESANPEWQRRLARRISGTTDPDLEPKRWWQRAGGARLAIAGVSLAALAVVGSWLAVQRYQIRQKEPASAERLLARAYTDKRTMELRMAGADYAPVRMSRGTAVSFTNRPTSLLKAEALIAGQLESHPSDSTWLQAQAQADLLEGKYDGAVEALRRALELDPHSPALLIDLATAYFQRGQQDDRKDDFGAAYEYLSRALVVLPDEPVALFNRAIVAEHLFLYQQALDDWDHYLRVDSGSRWSEEARNRAEAVREKLKEHQSKAPPLLSPAQIAAMANGAEASSDVDGRIEEYLHEAVRSWLPQAFPEARANGDPRALQALFFLADLTSQQHGDRWLSDLLRGSSAPQFRQAVTVLARAVRTDEAGEYDPSRKQAELAEQLFRASGNIAGVLRAQFEQSFADQTASRGEDCRRRARSAAAEYRRYAYPWMEIQLGLEVSVCSELMGDLGTHEKAAGRALNRARQAGYGALSLRALGFLAESKLEMGDRPSDWKLVSTGLDQFWSGQFPAVRGYNLYVEEAFATEADHANLQLAIWREAARLIDGGENLRLRAEAHSSMANAASAAHQPEVAKRHYEEAARLYALAPQTEATRVNRLWSEILTAELETGQSTFDAALVRLTRAQDDVRQLSNSFLTQVFYSTLGEVQLRSHHAAEAERDFRPALRLAEQSLASLTSEKSRTSWSRNAAPVYLGLAEAELAQGREQESLDVFEWYLGAPQRVGRRSPELSQSLPESSRLPARFPLLSNQTVLALGVLPDGVAIWVYDDRGASTRWIPKSPQEMQDLQDLASDFQAQCSDPGSQLSALRRNGRTLYEELVAPVEQRLAPGRTLVIEAEGWLARVPFEALLDSHDQYLIERTPIVHSLGQDSQARLRSETGISPDSPALVVGSTASSPVDGLIPLPDVSAEADSVASGFHSARVLKSGQVGLNSIRSALPGAAVFHFAGHALATPETTGLVLEGDGHSSALRLMDAGVVRQLQLQSLQLAVLSACNTAPGKGGSSGFDSVTDALLRAGVPHVVASRWAVDSAETRGFIQDFYHGALSGQTVPDAVRLTTRKMLANPRTSHPYYWSAFAAYGRS